MRHETTGETVERELFGSVEHAPEFPRYLPYQIAMDTVRSMQPEGSDPHDPKKDFPAQIMWTIEKSLGIAGLDQVSFFTANESPLDRFHGVDGWFEYQGHVVTIDLTTNPEKEEHKADIVFLVPHDGLDRTVDEQQFILYSDNLAREVLARL